MRKGSHAFIHTIKSQYNATLVTNPGDGRYDVSKRG